MSELTKINAINDLKRNFDKIERIFNKFVTKVFNIEIF